MTHQEDYTLPSDLATQGLEKAPELIRILINQAIQAERGKYLNAGQYERTRVLQTEIHALSKDRL